MTTATVLSAKELAQQIRYNGCVRTFAMHQARGKAKEQIRARGDKVSHYSARDITEMAEVILAQNQDVYLKKARAWADDWQRRGWR